MLVAISRFTRTTTAALLAASIATSVACSDTPIADPNSQRALTTGRIVGLLNDRGAHEWRGLRLAAPPTGDQRWRPPRLPGSWSGTRAALSFGNPCPQYERAGDTVMGSEDCLFANVVAPPFAPDSVPGGPDRRLPRWQAWHADNADAAFLVFDAPADGGIRHSTETESDDSLLADIASDSRFRSECDRCEAMAGMVPGRLPDYETLPQACSQYFSPGEVLVCPASWW